MYSVDACSVSCSDSLHLCCREGLLCPPSVADPLWYEAKDAPDFVELWNRPMPPDLGGLQKNVVDCIEQVRLTFLCCK